MMRNILLFGIYNQTQSKMTLNKIRYDDDDNDDDDDDDDDDVLEPSLQQSAGCRLIFTLPGCQSLKLQCFITKRLSDRHRGCTSFFHTF